VKNPFHLLSAMLLAATVCAPLQAEEGMWTFDNLPIKEMQNQYQFTPAADWLTHVQHAALRVSEGCSAAFVSADGLLMTNQHCIAACLAQISSQKQDFIAEGFYAHSRDQEVRCPQMEVDQLADVQDVTAQVDKAVQGLADDDLVNALHQIDGKLEGDCAGGDTRTWSCQVVSLYHGGRYALYKYRRHQDVRLVFTPESAIADFGGDPDNFNFPRYALDVAILRAYDRERPLQGEYLRFATRDPAAGELVFTAGNPGSTERGWTVAELETMRDQLLVPSLLYYSEMRGLLEQFAHEGPEQRRVAYANLSDVENLIKDYQGQLQALQDPVQMARKSAEESALRAWVMDDPARRAKYGDPWAAIATAEDNYRTLITRYRLLEQAWGFESRLFDSARTLLRAAAERVKPNGRRLAEFRDSNLPSIEQAVLSPVPTSYDYEELMLGWSLSKLRAALGADDPLVRRVLGRQSPEQLARAAVQGTKLDSVAYRRNLWYTDYDNLRMSDDPMLQLAMAVDDAARAVRKQYEEQVQAVLRKQGELIAQARFARDGLASYPDATFTLRLSYGQVRGWDEQNQPVPAFTDFAGLYSRATGSDPFALPRRWLDAKPRLNPKTAFDFVTTNDIVGGNSGSPIIDRDGDMVGLVFDGNIHSLGGDFWYDAADNRAVALDNGALLAALRNVYGMGQLADELVNGRAADSGQH
jgi:hypothetical protein